MAFAATFLDGVTAVFSGGAAVFFVSFSFRAFGFSSDLEDLETFDFFDSTALEDLGGLVVFTAFAFALCCGFLPGLSGLAFATGRLGVALPFGAAGFLAFLADAFGAVLVTVLDFPFGLAAFDDAVGGRLADLVFVFNRMFAEVCRFELGKFLQLGLQVK